MAEGSLRTTGTAELFANAKSQPSRCESRRIVVLDHQPRRFGLNNFAAGPHELTQKPGNVRRGSVRSSPRSAQLPPVRTVPIPLLGLRITAPRFGRGAFHLARDHLFQLEPSESLSRVLHAQGLKDIAVDERENVRPAVELRNPRDKQDPHARVLIPGAGGEIEARANSLFGELRQRRMLLAQVVVIG